MKDKDYIAPWACPPGRKFTNEQGEPMTGQQLLSARNAAKQEWVRRNPELAACLVGKDYQTQFEKSFLEPLKNVLYCVGWQHEKTITITSFFG